MDRPECNEKPPDLTQSVELLKYLLGIEIKRLVTAVRIEKERNIVFPETTIIIRDIQKLNEAINITHEHIFKYTSYKPGVKKGICKCGEIEYIGIRHGHKIDPKTGEICT